MTYEEVKLFAMSKLTILLHNFLLQRKGLPILGRGVFRVDLSQFHLTIPRGHGTKLNIYSV